MYVSCKYIVYILRSFFHEVCMQKSKLSIMSETSMQSSLEFDKESGSQRGQVSVAEPNHSDHVPVGLSFQIYCREFHQEVAQDMRKKFPKIVL